MGDAAITIVAPYEAMQKLNGIPASLNTVDTFWNSGAGKRMTIPEATLVAPGEVKEGLYDISLTETRYKQHHFTNDDIARIKQSLGTHEHAEFERKWGEVQHDMTAKEKMLAKYANEMAVNATIEHLGYKVQPGGMWAWGGSWDVTESTSRLAHELGTVCVAHTGSVNGDLEQKARYIVDVLDFMKEALQTEQSLHYKHGSYQIPGTRHYLGQDTYLEVRKNDFFKKMLGEMDATLGNADEATREVYAEWKRHMQPEIEAVQRGVEALSREESLKWQLREQARMEAREIGASPNPRTGP